MARIRNLKPQFWDSPDTAKADLAVRLAFMAMWNWADDSGRGTANLKELEAFAFPNDDVRELPRKPTRANCATVWRNFRDIVAEVQRCYGVVFYRVRGRGYYWIPSFKANQSKDFKPNSPLPSPDEGVTWDLTCEDSEDASLAEPAIAQSPLPTAQSPLPTAEKVPLDRDRDRDKEKEPCATSSRESAPPTFDDFWSAYPRRRDRRKAQNAFRNALKRADAATIIDGARRYRDDPNREEQFTKYAEGWLNGDGWLDEPLPPRQIGRQPLRDPKSGILVER